MTRAIRFGVPLLALCIATPLFAQPAVTIDIVAEREIVDPDDGSVRRVPAENVVPGAELIYTVLYTNSGTEIATGVVVENPIPDSVSYVADSAEPDDWPVVFSVDDGKTFAAPDALTHEIRLPDGGRTSRPVPTELYTHLRWTIPALEPGAQGNLTYRARVR